MFTLGNMSALAGTFFLVGPMAQLKNMATKERMASAAAFVLAMMGTLMTSIYVRSHFALLSDVCKAPALCTAQVMILLASPRRCSSHAIHLGHAIHRIATLI